MSLHDLIMLNEKCEELEKEVEEWKGMYRICNKRDQEFKEEIDRLKRVMSLHNEEVQGFNSQIASLKSENERSFADVNKWYRKWYELEVKTSKKIASLKAKNEQLKNESK